MLHIRGDSVHCESEPVVPITAPSQPPWSPTLPNTSTNTSPFPSQPHPIYYWPSQILMYTGDQNSGDGNRQSRTIMVPLINLVLVKSTLQYSHQRRILFHEGYSWLGFEIIWTRNHRFKGSWWPALLSDSIKSVYGRPSNGCGFLVNTKSSFLKILTHL